MAKIRVTSNSVSRQIVLDENNKCNLKKPTSLKIEEKRSNSSKSSSSRRSSKNIIPEDTESEEEEKSHSSSVSSKKSVSRKGSNKNHKSKNIFGFSFGKEQNPNQNQPKQSVLQIVNVNNNQILTTSKNGHFSSPDTSPGYSQQHHYPLFDKKCKLQQKITELEHRMQDSTKNLINSRKFPNRYLPNNPNQPLYFSTGNFSQLGGSSNQSLVTRSQTFHTQMNNQENNTNNIKHVNSVLLNHSRSSQAVGSLQIRS